MEKQHVIETIDQFNIIGISVRTTNENEQSAKDIPALWDKLMREGIVEQIPNKTGNAIYCIYTDYEKDYTKPYTTILGCKVGNLETIPNGMVGEMFERATYAKHMVKGNLTEGIVFNEWVKIWNSDLDRAYTADFEVYDERTQNPENELVDIFIAIR